MKTPDNGNAVSHPPWKTPPPLGLIGCWGSCSVLVATPENLSSYWRIGFRLQGRVESPLPWKDVPGKVSMLLWRSLSWASTSYQGFLGSHSWWLTRMESFTCFAPSSLSWPAYTLPPGGFLPVSGSSCPWRITRRWWRCQMTLSHFFTQCVM